MPITKSAIKKMRQDNKKRLLRKRRFEAVKKAISLAKKRGGLNNFKKAISLIDKATKIGIFHKNKANRIKSSLAKILKKKLNAGKENQAKEKKISS